MVEERLRYAIRFLSRHSKDFSLKERCQINNPNYTKILTLPFDLLRVPPTAEIADLWNEYAIATKGKSCFRFARGFKAVINEYFKQHPDRDPVSAMSRPKEFSIVGLRDEVYHLLYRNLKVVEVKRIIANFVKSAGFRRCVHR